MDIKEQRKLEIGRATARARLVLKPGDRITFTSCPGTKRWGVFQGFDVGRHSSWIRIATRDDVCAINISKVNGKAVDFSDAGGLPLPHGEQPF